jgi:drug/metabolite transporter (DMT)-like permease
MAEAQTQKLGLLARVILIGLILLIVAGVIWHGIAISTIQRVWRQLVERPDGPMAFRFILQPSMAEIAAFLRVRRDARAGRSPYLWRVISSPKECIEWLREGLNATARIILLGLIMDAIYQVIVFKRFYPVEAVIIAVLLGFVPYVILRGVFTPILRRGQGGASAHQT